MAVTFSSISRVFELLVGVSSTGMLKQPIGNGVNWCSLECNIGMLRHHRLDGGGDGVQRLRCPAGKGLRCCATTMLSSPRPTSTTLAASDRTAKWTSLQLLGCASDDQPEALCNKGFTSCLPLSEA